MANPPKKKGTAGENEVVAVFAEAGIAAKRTSPGVNYDLYVAGHMEEPFQILATRPDRGRWLATLPLEDLVELLRAYNTSDPDWAYPIEVEVKRYARLALHTIYDKKFGKKKD